MLLILLVILIQRLVHDVCVDEDSPTSSRSDPETDCDTQKESSIAIVSAENESDSTHAYDRLYFPWKGERRRRKLPEIPKNKKGVY